MNHPSRLVWLDLETTGLNPAEGIILEYGIIITDLELNEKSRKSWVLPWSRDTLLENLKDAYVLNMHMSNGLFKASHTLAASLGESNSKERRSNTHQEVRDFLKRDPHKDTYLAGSSIHFDRMWQASKNPKLLKMVSHRMGDVSANLVFFPELFPKNPNAKPTKHRAIDDLEASIEMHRTMRRVVAAGIKALEAEA